MIKTISTTKAPAVVGPYSQALEVNNFVFCSGQIGIDPRTNTVAEGIGKQTTQILRNLEAVLISSGSKLNKVVKTTIYLKSMADYVLVNQIYGSFFKENKPARVTVEVSRLPKDCLIEIDAIAVKN